MSRVSRVRWLAMVLPALILSGASGPTESGEPDADDRCPVCGMLVAPHADWLARVETREGEALFFDGAKDLFRFLLEAGFEERRPTDSETNAIFVTTYYEREPIDARTALYVVGSDVLGPMGAELVPHATRDAAEEFSRDHGGTAIVGFGEVTEEVLAGLR